MNESILQKTRRSYVTTSPFLAEKAIIPGLIPALQEVPEDPVEWAIWRDRVKAYRELVRRQCRTDKHQQRAEMALCAADPVYWLTMYGVIFEPRSIAGNAPAWYPWIPFPFQVKLIRWIQDVMSRDSYGRGDGIVEKSRDMGASWTFCAYIAHQWLFEPVFIAGCVSRNADQVDKTNSSDTIFYKIKALLGLLNQVPASLRLPTWMMPKGMSDDYVTLRNISHPTKTCIIQGETTTTMTGVGGRATLRFNDEAARFDDFDEAWANQSGTSTHRFAVSSADTRSPGFRALADLGKAGLASDETYAPSYMRLDWWVHPYHDQQWYLNEKARFAHDPHFFSREYEIDYHAGEGDAVYPRFQQTELGHFPYDPSLGTLWCAIDPGVRDPSALVWIQEDPITRRYRVITSFEGKGGEDPEFIASILVGIPVSGHGGYDYGSYRGLLELMDWTANLNRPVVYVGDPYGNHRGGDGKRTFYDALREASTELTDRRNVIHVRTVTRDDARTFMKRKSALSALAPRMDFNDSLGASAVLTALKESRYPERKDGRGYVTEVLEPQHDRYSHIRSSCEFWAVNIELQEIVKTTPVVKPVRLTMSGKVRA